MTPETDLTQYRELLTQAIQECQANHRPARAAYLMHYIRGKKPSFKLSDLGFANFRELLAALGGFTVTHDGYDIVAGLGGQPSTADQFRSSRFEKIHPSLWRALIGQTPGPLYLDLHALRDARQVVLRTTRTAADEATLIEVPAVSQSEQATWLVAWAERKSLAPEAMDRLRTAVQSGGLQGGTVVLRQEGLDHQFLIDRIEWTKGRLRRWLDEHGLLWGPPIVETYRPPIRSVAQPMPAADLREVVMQVLERLPQAELRQLWLPVGLVYDVICEKRSG